MTRRLDRFLQQMQRTLTLGPAHRPAPRPPATEHPSGHAARPALATAVPVAALGPLTFGIALIPLREHLSQSISLVMVLPVLLIAVVVGARLGALGALSAALTFDVFHTLPHYRLAIEDPDDVAEMLVLLVVGVLTGLVTESAQRAIASTRVRQRELTAVTRFVDRIGVGTPDELVTEAQRSIEQLLLATACRWQPGYRGTAAPVLARSGALAAGGYRGVGATPTARLPVDIEIPVGSPPHEHGRFVVRTSDAEISIEERRAAATVAAGLGRLLDRYPA